MQNRHEPRSDLLTNPVEHGSEEVFRSCDCGKQNRLGGLGKVPQCILGDVQEKRSTGTRRVVGCCRKGDTIGEQGELRNGWCIQQGPNYIGLRRSQ